MSRMHASAIVTKRYLYGIEIKISPAKTDGTDSWVVTSGAPNGTSRCLLKTMLRYDQHTMGSVRPAAWTMQPTASTSYSSRTGAPTPMVLRNWEHKPAIDQVDESGYPVPKKMTNLLRHHPELREEDGAVEWKQLLLLSNKTSHSIEDVSNWGPQERIYHLRGSSNKARFEYCMNSQDEIHYMQALSGLSGGVRVDHQTAEECTNTIQMDRLHLSCWSIIGLRIYCPSWFARWWNQ